MKGFNNRLKFNNRVPRKLWKERHERKYIYTWSALHCWCSWMCRRQLLSAETYEWNVGFICSVFVVDRTTRLNVEQAFFYQHYTIISYSPIRDLGPEISEPKNWVNLRIHWRKVGGSHIEWCDGILLLLSQFNTAEEIYPNFILSLYFKEFLNT